VQDGPAAKSAAARTQYARPALQTSYAAPTNEVERTLAGIWQEVLGIERIGIHDRYFDLGGHSLLATQILTQIRGIFRVDLSMRLFFGMATIKRTAKYIEDALWLRQGPSAGAGKIGQEEGEL